MDFSFTDDQESLRGLARQIFADHCTHERLKEITHDPTRFDRKLWSALAKAGLLDFRELGFMEACILLEEAGRAVAPVPLWSTAVSALALNRFGPHDSLAEIASGDFIVTTALEEPDNDDPYKPRTQSTGYRSLLGVKTCVPAGSVANAALVPAMAGDKPAVFWVDEFKVEPQETTSLEIQSRIEFEQGPEVARKTPIDLRWLVDHATAALCAMQAGVCEAALRMTAAYVSEREQFDRKLAAFQAVSQRAADAYIDTEAVRLSAWQAVWRLSEDLPAEAEIATAKFWASEGAQRVVHAAQHLHGGIGVDVDYPVHRYFLWAKQIELTLGAATPQLVRLGEVLAR